MNVVYGGVALFSLLLLTACIFAGKPAPVDLELVSVKIIDGEAVPIIIGHFEQRHRERTPSTFLEVRFTSKQDLFQFAQQSTNPHVVAATCNEWGHIDDMQEGEYGGQRYVGSQMQTSSVYMRHRDVFSAKTLHSIGSDSTHLTYRFYIGIDRKKDAQPLKFSEPGTTVKNICFQIRTAEMLSLNAVSNIVVIPKVAIPSE